MILNQTLIDDFKKDLILEATKNKKPAIWSDLASNTFKFVQEGEQIDDKFQAIIGDEKSNEFKPHLKISKWDECEVEIWADENNNVTVTKEENKLKAVTKDKEYHFYEIAPVAIGWEKWYEPYVLYKEGGIDFETILKCKPLSNILVYKIKAKNVKFYYQPILTDKEKLEMYAYGKFIVFPEVEGSYAVYHKDKKNDYSNIGGKNYRYGKVGHIYRPQIEDANGVKVWGKLSIDENKEELTVTIPQDFLDTAVYPIRHASGLTFGNTVAGASSADVGGTIRSSLFTGIAGTGVDITASLSNAGAAATYKYNIYLHSDLSQLTNGPTAEGTIAASATKAWFTQSFVSAPTFTAVDYLIAAWASAPGSVDKPLIYYDAGAANQGHYDTEAYGTWPDPLVPTHDNNEYSIYATYTAGGGATLKSINGLALASIKSINGLAKASIKSINGLTLS